MKDSYLKNHLKSLRIKKYTPRGGDQQVVKLYSIIDPHDKKLNDFFEIGKFCEMLGISYIFKFDNTSLYQVVQDFKLNNSLRIIIFRYKRN